MVLVCIRNSEPGNLVDINNNLLLRVRYVEGLKFYIIFIELFYFTPKLHRFF